MVEFPEFEKISPCHEDAINAVAINFPPHSDFNFAGLYDYDVDQDKKVCLLNDGIAFILTDYLSNNKFCSYLGISNIDVSLSELISFSQKHLHTNHLRLIPEYLVSKLSKKSQFRVVEDIDNNDYLISASELTTLSGRRWYKVRREIKLFHNKYRYRFKQINLLDEEDLISVQRVFDRWCKQHGGMTEDSIAEKTAMERSLLFAGRDDHYAFGLYIDDQMIGYSINQTVHDACYIGHFGKADNSFPGAYKVIEHECAKFFLGIGYEYMNMEQDLGIPNLRLAKRSLNPIGYIKKYNVWLN